MAHLAHKLKQDGFAKVDNPVFTEETFNNFRKRIYQIIKAESPGLESSNITDLHIRHPIVLKWLISDEVLDLVESAIGPDFAFWTTSIFYKGPNSNEKAYWHKDIYGLDTNTLFSRNEIYSLLISVDVSTIESGCVNYLPGSHVEKYKHDAVTPDNSLFESLSMIDPAGLPVKTAVPVLLQQNEASFHNINTVHGSEPNRSSQGRALVSAKFFPADVECYLKNFNGITKPYLVRGTDIANSQLKPLALPK